MSEGTQDITEYNDGLSVDIELPEIPIPTTTEEEKKIIKDEVEVAFKFAFIGAGQGGSRLAETFNKFGYRKIIVRSETTLQILRFLFKKTQTK